MGGGSSAAWLVVDDLIEFITDAQDFDLEFAGLPFSSVAYYELLSFPDYLAGRVANDARRERTISVHVDMWALLLGATYALTYFFQGKEGVALDRFVLVANRILINPNATVDRVVWATRSSWGLSEARRLASILSKANKIQPGGPKRLAGPTQWGDSR